MKSKHALSVAALALAAVTASAQTQAPGLWEHSFTMKSDDGKMEKAMAEMQKQLASMPPEQRKPVPAACRCRCPRGNPRARLTILPMWE